MVISIVIPGSPITKKNSQQIITTGGRPRLIQSAKYRLYERESLKELLKWGNICFDTPVQVKCLYWLPDRRKRDLCNLMAATHDILEKAGIIADDALIYSVDGSRIMGKDDRPRVEITIQAMHEIETEEDVNITNLTKLQICESSNHGC